MNKRAAILLSLCLSGVLCFTAHAEEPINYRASLTAVCGTDDYAPYMIGSWNAGRTVAGKAIQQGAMLWRGLDTSRRWGWGYGIEYSAGYSNAFSYDRYDGTNWGSNSDRTASMRLIQLYGQLKYRQVYILAGMKERASWIVDGTLSSGDLVRSNNARPIPGVAVGFIDFVDVPFTNGRLQINGEIMYGRFTDGGFRDGQFNRYQGLLTQDLCYTYKRCYFRTDPHKPLSVTFGMQTAGEFGGSTARYTRGTVTESTERGFKLGDMWDMFIPREGSGEGYYKGNSLGSWDFKTHYTFKNGSSIDAYFEWPWEDGSGIGRRNGWDGVWGLQYTFSPGSVVESVVFEYLDFTNQGGPIHRTASDSPGTDLTSEANGGDNYWNNDFYGAYANYGMSIGTPFVVAPVYNGDGSSSFLYTRARGFHAAARGRAGDGLQWRAMVSYEKAGGSGRIPAKTKKHNTSAMVEARWIPARHSLPSLELKAQVAADAGDLRGDNFGICIGLSYSGLFTIGKRQAQ